MERLRIPGISEAGDVITDTLNVVGEARRKFAELTEERLRFCLVEIIRIPEDWLKHPKLLKFNLLGIGVEVEKVTQNHVTTISFIKNGALYVQVIAKDLFANGDKDYTMTVEINFPIKGANDGN